MADQIYDKIVIRNDVEANWASANPVLLAGEIGIAMDTIPKKFKIGDGILTWNELSYNNPSMTINDITGLSTELNGKAEVSDIPTALSELSKDINFDERYHTKTDVNNLLDNKLTVPTQAEWDNFRLTLQG